MVSASFSRFVLIIILFSVQSICLAIQSHRGNDFALQSELNGSSPRSCEVKESDFFDTYTIINTYRRPDPLFYTQGLTFKDTNTLLESAGLYGESSIQYINLDDMMVKKKQELDDVYFGEGCCWVGNEVFQLTYKEREVLVWDARTLSLKRKIPLPAEIKEGWGLANRIHFDKNKRVITELYVSDGSDKIYILDPYTFQIKRTIQAVLSGCQETIDMLNELEFVKGKLWANIYFSPYVAVIDPEDGFVEGLIDFTGLTEIAEDEYLNTGKKWQRDYYLNGIAYHNPTDRLIITGKKYPVMWEVKVDRL